MKQAKYIGIACALILAGCTGKFEDINSNPNKIEVGGIVPSGLLEPLLMDGVNSLISDTYSLANEIAQVSAAVTSNVREEHRYNLANSNFVSVWNSGFRRATDAQHMYELAVAQGDVNYQAIALTMKVFYLYNNCDMFGPIPYTEALHGKDGIMKPRVDSQQEAYEAMMADLETANSLYNPMLSLSDSSKDAMYGGDLNKWKKFTNSLHLRLLTRVSGRNTAFTPTVAERINTIISDPATYPVFESNADNATVKYTGGETYRRNQFNTTSYPTENGFTGDHQISEQILLMTVDQTTGEPFDPRIRIWGKTRQVDDFKWIGAVCGCTSEYGNENRQHGSYMHYEVLVNDTNPNHVMDYSELLFIKAEAALKGWIAGSAEEYYKAAIKASCEKWNVFGAQAAFPTPDGKGTMAINISAGDMDALLADSRVAYNAAKAEQLIAEQKWLSLYWVAGWEMYHEMRRTGYPNVEIGKGAIDRNRTDGKFPARFAYPVVAMANNHDNYVAALQSMGGAGEDDNTMILPVWWSGQAVAKDNGTPWEHSFRTLRKGTR